MYYSSKQPKALYWRSRELILKFTELGKWRCWEKEEGPGKL
jgi:hypothetical protein